jgi:hypothetical protein
MFGRRRKKNNAKTIIGKLLKTVMDYPNTFVGIILAAVIGLLLFSVPLIGHWLFFIVEPLLLIAFIVMFGSRDYGRS